MVNSKSFYEAIEALDKAQYAIVNLILDSIPANSRLVFNHPLQLGHLTYSHLENGSIYTEHSGFKVSFPIRTLYANMLEPIAIALVNNEYSTQTIES